MNVIQSDLFQDYTSREPALPYGKAGILITVDSGDFIKAGKEAVNVLNEVRCFTFFLSVHFSLVVHMYACQLCAKTQLGGSPRHVSCKG
jgi:hypothetical protein